MNTIRSSRPGRPGPGSLTRGVRAARSVATVFLAAVLVASCAKQEGGSSAPAGRGAIGSEAPAFSLPDLNGNSVASSSLRGKVVILDFWATWCPPCRAEVPDLVRLQAKYRDQGLAVVGLSLDAGGAKDVQPFVEEHDVNYTMLIGNEEITKAYGNISMIPTKFVLDRDGKVVQRFVGQTPPEVIEQTIRPLLAAG